MNVALPAPSLDTNQRIKLTLSCRDADELPRVEKAGKLEIDPDTGWPSQIMHNGLRVVQGSYYGAWITSLIEALQGVHEPQEEVIFASLLPQLPQKATMVELGAYWSYYTIWFLSQYPKLRRGIALEMDPAHIGSGKQNAQLNGVEIEFLLGCIGAEDKAAEDMQTESSGIQAVPTFGIEGVMREKEIEHINLLLCDAQGGETGLLAGIDNVVAQGRISIVVISTHHHLISGDPLTHQRALAKIQSLGGTIRVEHDVSESFSGDGLIVADFDGSLANWTPPEISYCRSSESLFRNPLYDLADAQERHRVLITEIENLKSQFTQPNKALSTAASQSRTTPSRYFAAAQSWMRRAVKPR